MTMTWHTTTSARAEWVGAPADEQQLQSLLDVSRAECIAYAPISVADAIASPAAYRWAHLAHARNIWNAATVNPSAGFGADEGSFVIRPFPLDWAVKQRLRPSVLFGGVTG